MWVPAETLVDANLMPDWLVRAGIRRVAASRLREQSSGGPLAQAARFDTLIEWLDRQPIAARPAAANAQHYDLPAEFFELILGPHLKYSCAWWPGGVASLAEAEVRMLRLTSLRARLHDGQSILELGCGWGSLTLYMAAAFPASHIVAVSNSSRQRDYILKQARARGLSNLEVITADINDFDVADRFDRVVSVEMFEHVRNYRALFARIAGWMNDDGRLFVHVFAHSRFAYPFEVRAASDWMAKHFFTGGMMPSADLFRRAQDAWDVEAQWTLNGSHYRRTAAAWLQNMDRRREALDGVLAQTYGASETARWRTRWRVFFLACAEMFGYGDGREWIVCHYLFRKKA